jgi:hypothetical protein
MASRMRSSRACILRPQVTRYAGVDLLHPSGDPGYRVVLVAIVHRFELAAINRNNGTGEKFEPTAKLHELTTHRLNRHAIVLAEIGNRLEVRGSRPTNHINSILRCASRSRRRLD